MTGGMEMKQRITSFDTFRAIAAFIIVFLHYPLLNRFTDEAQVLVRIAVPYFFMVSGYFHYGTKELKAGKILRELKKIISLTIIVNIVYLILRLSVKSYYCIQRGQDLHRLWNRIFSQLARPRYIWFNFGLAGHLWYLRAMIFVVLIFAIMKKFKLHKVVKFSIPFILILDLSMCKYSIALFGWHYPRRILEPMEKFIGVAYLYFFIGYFYREFEQTERFEKMKQVITKSPIIPGLMIVVAAVLNIVEAKWLENHKWNVQPYNYIGTLLLILAIFIALSCYKTLGSKTGVHKIGMKYSEYIYFYHVLAGKLLAIFLKGKEIYPYYLKVRPFVIYFTVIFVTMFFIHGKELLKKCMRLQEI